jgi:type I restriction enzyme S subunit
LDDKIELNRRMNATLEEMARALFRAWFVDFDPVYARAAGEAPAHMPPETAALFPDSFGDDGLPMGWRMGTLGEVATSPRRGVKPADIDPTTPYIGLEHMPRRSVALDSWEGASKVGSQKSAMRRGEFLFGKLRPYFHKVGIVPVDGICSTDIVVVAPKKLEWAAFVLSVISSDEFVEHTNGSSSGTRMPRTSWKDMAAFRVAMPQRQAALAFEERCRPMRERILANIYESRTLADLRDALLPRLMSGELRVRDAEAMVGGGV